MVSVIQVDQSKLGAVFVMKVAASVKFCIVKAKLNEYEARRASDESGQFPRSDDASQPASYHLHRCLHMEE